MQQTVNNLKETYIKVFGQAPSQLVMESDYTLWQSTKGGESFEEFLKAFYHYEEVDNQDS